MAVKRRCPSVCRGQLRRHQRAGLGCQTPYDILPAVWLSSAVSVTAGVLAARFFRGGKL